MRIKVDDIPEDGLEIELDAQDAWAMDAAREALEGPVTRLHAQLQVTRIAELVRVSGQASAGVDRDCDRCGGPIHLELGGTVELIYEPPPLAALAEEEIKDAELMDIGWFDGVHLDLADVLMEQLSLWLPARIRCGQAKVSQRGEAWTCRLPEQQPMPELGTHKPFAKLRLPE